MQEWALARRREGRRLVRPPRRQRGQPSAAPPGRRTCSNRDRPAPPEDYKASEGARFEVHFEKTRGFTGPDAEPFEATLTEGGWATRNLDDVLDGQVWALHQQGITQRVIAQQVGKSAPTVNRIIKRLEALA